MSELFLILVVAGQRVALQASQVESVVELDGLTPVPGVPHHVAGLAALRSRVLTVIDPYAILGQPRPHASVHEAVVIEHEGHPYALLVDVVHDVVEACGDLLPVQAALAPAWARLCAGLVEVEGQVMILLDTAAVLSGAAEPAPAVSALSTIAA